MLCPDKDWELEITVVWISETKGFLADSTRRWKNNIKNYLREILWKNFY